MLGREMRRLERLRPCAQVQRAEAQAARAGLRSAREALDQATQSEVQATEALQSMFERFGAMLRQPRTLEVQQMLLWRVALGDHAHKVSDLQAATRNAEGAFEEARRMLARADSRTRLLETLLSAAKRRVSRAREARQLNDAEFVGRSQRWLP